MRLGNDVSRLFLFDVASLRFDAFFALWVISDPSTDRLLSLFDPYVSPRRAGSPSTSFVSEKGPDATRR